MNPGFGEANVGALSGAVVGSIGGLFAPGLVRMVLLGDPGEFLGTPILGLICFVVSGVLAWLLGGQLGPRLAIRSRKAGLELVGGVIAGLIPVVLIGLWAWRMTARVA